MGGSACKRRLSFPAPRARHGRGSDQTRYRSNDKPATHSTWNHRFHRPDRQVPGHLRNRRLRSPLPHYEYEHANRAWNSRSLPRCMRTYGGAKDIMSGPRFVLSNRGSGGRGWPGRDGACCAVREGGSRVSARLESSQSFMPGKRRPSSEETTPLVIQAVEQRPSSAEGMYSSCFRIGFVHDTACSPTNWE